MSPRIARYSGAVARGLAVAGVLLLIGYPLAVAFAISANQQALTVMLSLAFLGVLAWAMTPRWRAAAMAALAVVAVGALLSGHATQLSFLPSIAINLGLAGVFGATLRAGREPLVSRIARLERGTLDQRLLRYTRTLTMVWTAFFVAMAGISAALSTLSSLAAWAWFTAVGNWVCVAALLFGEFCYRRVRLARYPHASPAQVWALVRAKWRTSYRE